MSPTQASEAAFTAFRERVVATPGCLSQLEAIAEPEAFVAKTVELGVAAGLTFGPEEVRTALQAARRAWVERNVRLAVDARSSSRPLPAAAADGVPLDGWTPLYVGGAEDEPCIEWCRLGAERFTDPFFEQTITRVLRHPARMLFRRATPLHRLETLAEDGPGLQPRGFIFHLSRCGSTLLAQMLGALPTSVVVSEAPPLDQLLAWLRRAPQLSRAQRLARFRGLVNALGQKRRATDRDYFIKFDSWHVLELPFILEAFPDVPWIFLYRDPVEVMVSQHRQRGTQMIPGLVDPRTFGFEPAEVTGLSLDEYCARVLARTCEAAAACSHLGRGRLVNFSELPAALPDSLLDFFGGEHSAADCERLREVARLYSKTPALPYADDRAGKQKEATPDLRRLAAVWLADLYAALEARRHAQAAGAIHDAVNDCPCGSGVIPDMSGVKPDPQRGIRMNLDVMCSNIAPPPPECPGVSMVS